MKQTIAWHEDCQRNKKQYLKRLEAELAVLNSQITRLTTDIEFTDFQIQSAKAENKAEFDADKYKVKRG